jgi:hypothetical protein
MFLEKLVPGANHPPSTTTAFSRSSVVRVIELDRLLWIDLTLATEPMNDRYLRKADKDGVDVEFLRDSSTGIAKVFTGALSTPSAVLVAGEDLPAVPPIAAAIFCQTQQRRRAID